MRHRHKPRGAAPPRRPAPGPPAPRAGQITIYGRRPVLEALNNPACEVLGVVVAEGAQGDSIAAILMAAKARGVPVRQLSAERVSRISKNRRQDQGVAADLAAPGYGSVADFLDQPLPARLRLVALDGITTQDNVGLIIRSAVAAGFDGVVLPARGSAKLDPQVLKASAGTALACRILGCESLAEGLSALKAAGCELVGLDGAAETALFGYRFAARSILVLGSEHAGISAGVAAMLTTRLAIPMAAGIDSVNVACAATLACFELSRGDR